MGHRVCETEDPTSVNFLENGICSGPKTPSGTVNNIFFFIASGEISVYLVKIKVVFITSKLISYHFTSY